nr:MAG: internal scaffolding protein [Microvirus sp.]
MKKEQLNLRDAFIIQKELEEKSGYRTQTVRENGSLNIQSLNPDESMTQQQFKDQADINVIMSTYMKTGEFPLSQRQGFYADVSEVADYQTALNTVIKAEEAFMDLPAEIRKRFQNDPQEMLSFLADNKNDEEAISLGLKVPNPNTQINETQTQTQNDKK